MVVEEMQSSLANSIAFFKLATSKDADVIEAKLGLFLSYCVQPSADLAADLFRPDPDMELARRLYLLCRYDLAVVQIREDLYLPLSEKERAEAYKTALLYVYAPGHVHSRIVRHCQLFFSPSESGQLDHVHDPLSADLHALCAEGLAADPGSIQRLGFRVADPTNADAVAQASLALTLGGATRYRLLTLGWSLLSVGKPKDAIVALERALELPDGVNFERWRSPADTEVLIRDLLDKAHAQLPDQ